MCSRANTPGVRPIMLKLNVMFFGSKHKHGKRMLVYGTAASINKCVRSGTVLHLAH